MTNPTSKMKIASLTTRKAALLTALAMMVATVVHYDVLRILVDDNSDWNALRAGAGAGHETGVDGNVEGSIIHDQQPIDNNESIIDLETIHQRRRQLQQEGGNDNGVDQTEAFKNHFGIIFPEAENMPLHLRNTMESVDPSDIVFFWHIPKSAGHLMKVIMGTCFGLRRAERLKEPASLEYVRDTVVNMNTQTPEGIKDSRDMGLVDSGMVDVITSSFAISASSLFTFNHMGRAFTVMQHPITTAISKFADRKKIRPNLKNMTLAEYATMDYYPDNWMTRQLTGTLPGEPLTEEHLHRAKNILMSKFYVGIADNMEETVRQLRLYYGWTIPEGKEMCVKDFLKGEGDGKKFKYTPRNKPPRGSKDWNIVADREKWDMGLYYLGLEMFAKQSVLMNALHNPQSNAKSAKPSFW